MEAQTTRKHKIHVPMHISHPIFNYFSIIIVLILHVLFSYFCLLPPIAKCYCHYTHTLYSAFCGLLTKLSERSPFSLPPVSSLPRYFPPCPSISLPFQSLSPSFVLYAFLIPLLSSLSISVVLLSLPNSFHLHSTTLPLLLSLSEIDSV